MSRDVEVVEVPERVSQIARRRTGAIFLHWSHMQILDADRWPFHALLWSCWLQGCEDGYNAALHERAIESEDSHS